MIINKEEDLDDQLDSTMYHDRRWVRGTIKYLEETNSRFFCVFLALG